MTDRNDQELMLLVRAWMHRREIDGFEPEFRALVTDVLSRERVPAPTPDHVLRILDERLRSLQKGTTPDDRETT